MEDDNMIKQETLQKLHDETLANPGCMKVEHIERLFVNGEFNSENWNGGDGALIRRVINDFKDRHKIFQNTNILDNANEELLNDYLIANVDSWLDETYTTFITESNEIFFFKYYKDRGNITVALKDGHNMTEDEYLILLNKLERCGYDFGIYEMKL